MSELRFKIAMSLDGFIAGPNQSVENPLGEGGRSLHDWSFNLKAFRDFLGLGGGGEVNASTAVFEESVANVGATIMGRNMFGGHPGPWDTANPWNGWWGDNPPFHHPVFVLTHYPREPLHLSDSTFIFVTDGMESALEKARASAHGKDIALGGGAHVAQQYLRAGLVDVMEINLVPVLLGRGERLFEHVGDDLHGLQLVRTVAASGVVHLKFVRA